MELAAVVTLAAAARRPLPAAPCAPEGQDFGVLPLQLRTHLQQLELRALPLLQLMLQPVLHVLQQMVRGGAPLPCPLPRELAHE
eukprot:CAMPEP_0182910060 /NCGR_PEP_ID=MMETSP0034_2-20130328/36094_1 /TAXON_ID=156128 /ORGANISM="Nephroselmis pyriformis, Strain CCMP717" /LENGTH=83 /DNA_ID=CAMNT_0025046357 /DNA_START=198 /DNA_END=446 /DNA_ORIENTATION=-